MSTNLDDTFNVRPEPKAKAITRDDILNHLRWRTQQEVVTVKGPRLKKCALATPYAIELFAREKNELYKLGYTLTQPPAEKGRWLVTKWDLVPAKVVIARQEAREMSRATSSDADIPRPEGMEYYPFQKAGIAFGVTRRATLFGDEPGLGKTCQAIGTINCTPEAKTILIVCPAALKLNWLRELQMWLIRQRPIFVADSKMMPVLRDGIVIQNYDNLQKHSDIIRDTEWDIVIADEAHYLKNPDAKRTRVLFGDRCTPKERAMGMADLPPITVNHRKMLLTGTPICNRPKELFPLIHFLDPINWTSKSRYQARYCGACSENGWNADGATNLAELQDKLRSTIMIRRLKKDVLTELPPKTRRVVEFAPTGKMKEMIKAERDMLGTGQAYEDAVERMMLKPIIGDRPTYRRVCAEEKAAMPEVLSYLDDAVEESGKVVIFVWHREVYRRLRAHFGPRAVGMNGDTPPAERQAAVDSFQQSPAINVIIGQILTMGTGLTLTASNRVIMFELDDVPGNVTQSEDRCHRIGQKDNVLVEHLIITGTIDARMAQNCIAKQNIIDRALDQQKST
jgi:SWI/SNF-related matrix-associated actin-dependent regulator 1 of chromatin subfamily A